MDSWPASTRPKGKEKKPLNYPILDHGILSAATLFDNHGRLEWSHIAKKKSTSALRAGKSVTVFPATRPLPFRASKMSILHQAEQGANFLRTYLPDVDIAAELIRDELTEDAKLLLQWDVFDPHLGNQLDTVVQHDSTYLAFPMGELNRDLNISSLIVSEPGKILFKASAEEIRSFDTPVLQVTSATFEDRVPSQASYLAVRTFGGTSLLELQTHHRGNKAEIHTKELGTIVSADIGGKPAVDVKLSSTLHSTLVNSQGSVYKCDLAAGFKMQLVHPPVDPPFNDEFWRIELTQSHSNFLLLSKNHLVVLDDRSETSSQDIYNAISNEVLTSVEDHRADQILRVCSTNQIVWIDRRNTARPLLAFNHARRFDRSLEAKTISMGEDYLTMLSSRRNSLLTVYDVSRSEGSLASVKTPPYCLVASANGDLQTGHSFFRHPLEHRDSSVTFFRLSEVGALCAIELSVAEPGKTLFTWSEDVRRLNTGSAELREEFDPLDSNESNTVNMAPVYQRIFQKNTADDEDSIESLYDLVEKASSYWQDMNEPVDHVLTSYDILHRSGEEPNSSTRADFLSESVINSSRGYRSLLQGRVSADVLKKGAPWAHDLTETLCKFDSDFGFDPRSLTEHMRRFDLRVDDERSAESIGRESAAREQVVLDLTLARHVYSPHPFSTEKDVGGDLESMTKTLSLEDEPAAANFGFLRPIMKKTDEGEEKNAEETIPLGVRLLVKDWNIGQNPRDFVYRDLSDDTHREPPPIRSRQTSVEPKERPMVAGSQRPPTLVVAASSQFDTSRRFLSQDTRLQQRPPLASGSQPVETGLLEMSQEFMASTQILPGAYGGRPGTKKKMAKKRVGGF